MAEKDQRVHGCVIHEGIKNKEYVRLRVLDEGDSMKNIRNILMLALVVFLWHLSASAQIKVQISTTNLYCSNTIFGPVVLINPDTASQGTLAIIEALAAVKKKITATQKSITSVSRAIAKKISLKSNKKKLAALKKTLAYWKDVNKKVILCGLQSPLRPTGYGRIGVSLFGAMEGSWIYAMDGAYIGVFSKNPYTADSIANPYGTYGNQYSVKSIFDAYGTYGNRYSVYSPWNQFTTTPPIIVATDGTPLAYLTTNQFKGIYVDPSDLAIWFEQ